VRVAGAGSYMWGTDQRVHFGLGDAKEVDLEITWPGNERQTLRRVKTNRAYVLVEGRNAVPDDPGSGRSR